MKTAEQRAAENRENFKELVPYVDELKKTGPVKLIHAINFETGIEIGKRQADIELVQIHT